MKWVQVITLDDFLAVHLLHRRYKIYLISFVHLLTIIMFKYNNYSMREVNWIHLCQPIYL